MRNRTNPILYLRPPPRYVVQVAASNTPVPLALVVRGKPIRTFTAAVDELAAQLPHMREVVLLLPASEVTLLRSALPPLSAARLQAALPAFIEDHVIGDVADCAITAGPDIDGQRLIAFCDRDWLHHWVKLLRQNGARKIHAIPLSLCLPVSITHISAALLSHAHHHELTLRLSAHEALGLPLKVDQEAELPAAVAQLLATLTPLAMQRPIQLSVPTAQFDHFRAWVAAYPDAGVSLIEQAWADWINASTQVPLDLMNAIGEDPLAVVSWREWRWPIVLAGALALLNVIALNADGLRLRSEGLQLRDESAEIYQRHFPNEKVVLDPLAQMKQKITTVRQASGQLTASDFVVLSAALGEVWRETGKDLRAIATLDYRNGTLNVKLKQGMNVSPEALRSPLANRQLQFTPSPVDPLLWQVKPL